jgi:hypothetical protein
MIRKHPICRKRIRKVPGQFSWVDQRLVRDRFIEAITHPGAALYLFLVTVADVRGLSYYSDVSIMRRLSMDLPTLEGARRCLIAGDLIAYEKPLYQVLSLDPVIEREPPSVRMRPDDEPVAIKEIFKQFLEANR